MKLYTCLFAASLIIIAGCSQPSGPAPKAESPISQPNENLLASTILTEKPENVLSVTEALNAKDGQEIAVFGRVPPANVKPFNSGLAAFKLMAPDELEKPEVAEELSCPDAATCPSCQKLLKDHALLVEIVDSEGKIIPSPIEGFKEITAGSSVIVKGKVERNGENLRIKATGIIPVI